MRYISTRGGESVTAAQAIVRGICPSGGLYVPERFPGIEELKSLPGNYASLAALVMQPYLDIPENELAGIAKIAYSSAFDTEEIVPVVKLNSDISILELFHGPTLAFKDMALQMLPYLMRDSLKRSGENKGVYILVATSGDTGKAALEGFRDVNNTVVQVFYPDGGVSRAQWLQMVTQQGGNVHVCGVKGNFDDAQTAVKQIFANEAIRRKVEDRGYRLSSANSINFGRLLPQIAYYFSAYSRLISQGRINCGDKIDFCVPTGNFGNILAGYYALRMGLPVGKLICASNRNNVLTEFFNEGKYNSRRPFYKSMSCSIDILVSSNLERMLFEASGRNANTVSEWMRSLSGGGSYDSGKETADLLSKYFCADWCDEEATLKTIKNCFDANGYLMDPHTAVAQTILERYLAENGTERPVVLLSTAHPFKFASDVLRAFETPGEDDCENADRLSRLTGVKIPPAIASLSERPILHRSVCSIADMQKRTVEVL